MNTENDDIFDQDFSSPNFDEKTERDTENLTWLLRVARNSRHYDDFMAVNLTSDTSAVVVIKNKRYPFKFDSTSDMLAKTVDILGSDELPEPEE